MSYRKIVAALGPVVTEERVVPPSDIPNGAPFVVFRVVGGETSKAGQAFAETSHLYELTLAVDNYDRLSKLDGQAFRALAAVCTFISGPTDDLPDVLEQAIAGAAKRLYTRTRQVAVPLP